MQNLSLTTNDGIRFEKVGSVIQASGFIGGYRRLGNGEEFYFYSDLIEITEIQKLEFEGCVREIIRNVEMLEENI